MKRHSLKFRLAFWLAFGQAFWGCITGIMSGNMKQFIICMVFGITAVFIASGTDENKVIKSVKKEN